MRAFKIRTSLVLFIFILRQVGQGRVQCEPRNRWRQFPCTVLADIKHPYVNKGGGELDFHSVNGIDEDRLCQSNGFWARARGMGSGLFVQQFGNANGHLWFPTQSSDLLAPRRPLWGASIAAAEFSSKYLRHPGPCSPSSAVNYILK